MSQKKTLQQRLAQPTGRELLVESVVLGASSVPRWHRLPRPLQRGLDLTAAAVGAAPFLLPGQVARFLPAGETRERFIENQQLRLGSRAALAAGVGTLFLLVSRCGWALDAAAERGLTKLRVPYPRLAIGCAAAAGNFILRRGEQAPQPSGQRVAEAGTIGNVPG